MARFFYETALGIWMSVSSRLLRSANPRAIRRQTWRIDMKGLGLLMDDRLRTRLRRTWLRVVRRP
jgi:hypothetical protein